MRIDVRDTLLHSQHLCLAHGVVEGVNLPVDIRFSDVVQVNQREPGHTTARQGFSSPGADAAQADHNNMGFANFLSTCRAIKTGQAAKAALQIGIH